LPDKVGLNLLARLPADRHAARPQIAAIDGLARRLVERIAVAYGPFARNTNVEAVIDNREIEHAFETAVFVIADIDGCHGLELIGRLGRNHIHDTCGCIAAVKRALWSAQHFHLTYVIEFLLEEMIADEGNIVERDRYRRVGRNGDRLRADTADLDVVTGEIRFRKRQVRDLLHEIGAASSLCRGQLLL